MNDDGELVAVGRIEAAAVGNERRRDLTLSVFVLQALAVERRAARRRAEKEAARPAVAGRPDQIADALEAEHRVEDVERNHRQVVIRVRRAGGDPRRERPRLVDAFLENLSELVFAIPHQLLGILRTIELADRRVDAQLPEHAFHSERARLVGNDRHDARADRVVARDGVENANEGHRRRDGAIAAALQLRVEHRQLRHDQRGRLAPPLRQAAQRANALLQVAHVLTVGGRLVEGNFLAANRRVGDGQSEAVAESPHRFDFHLLGLMRDVLGLAGFAHAVTFDRFGQHDGRLAAMLEGRFICGVYFERIVPAALKRPNLVVGPSLDHLFGLGVATEESVADVLSVARFERLVIAVDALGHQLHETPALVGGKQRIPAASPDHLDHVPARAFEDALELLNDLSVAANRAVESLQVAVDDPNEIVELFAAGERDRTERFGLVGFAVADECPNFSSARLDQSAIVQITHEARLIDRHDRAQAHRDRRELPESGHQPRMRV